MENTEDPDAFENLNSVKFAKAKVKFICSKHSGSILAQHEPAVPLTSSNTLRASEIFLAASTFLASSEAGYTRSGSNTIPNVMLYELLINYGLVSKRIDIETVNQAIGRFYRGPPDMNESTFLEFLTAFEALPYHYGQRLRRNAGRGEAEALRELVIRGCNPNTADGEGLTSLHYACEFNRANIVLELHSLIGDDLLVNAKVSCFRSLSSGSHQQSCPDMFLSFVCHG